MVRSKIRNLKSVLANTLGDDVEILAEKTALLTAPGEHYGSIMLALDITIKRPDRKEEVLNLVAKLLPANEMLRIAFNVSVTFKKEVIAYLDSIPTLIAFQREHNVPESRILDIFPKCYGARVSIDKDEVDDDAVLIFENLKVKGYATDDRMKGFDFDDAKLILQGLAKFHAIPIALRLLRPEVFQKKIAPSCVKNSGLEQLPPEVGAAFHNAIMENAELIPELEPYLERVRKVVDANALAFAKPPPNETFATMVHSDYWVSNTMMLRDKNGRPLKNKMVDLQLMQYSSPIRDLVFFLFTSVINSVLDQHCDDFIKLYYDAFIENLKDFDIDLNPYSWDEFNKELEEVAPTEVYHILVMLKPIFTEREKIQHTPEEFQDSDWSRKDLLGPAHKRKLRDTVIALAKKNWI